jgi:hypothetical protein
MSGLDLGKSSFSSSYTGSKAPAADDAAEVDLDSSAAFFFSSSPSNPKTKATKRKREEAQIARLAALCEEVKAAGWWQVTASSFPLPNEATAKACRFKTFVVASPHHFTPQVIFRQLMSEVVSVLVSHTNAKFAREHDHSHACRVRTDEHEMWCFIAILLRFMG